MPRDRRTMVCPNCEEESLTLTITWDRAGQWTPPSFSVEPDPCDACGYVLTDTEYDRLVANLQMEGGA